MNKTTLAKLIGKPTEAKPVKVRFSNGTEETYKELTRAFPRSRRVHAVRTDGSLRGVHG